MRGCGGDSFLAENFEWWTASHWDERLWWWQLPCWKLWVVDSFSLRWEAVVVTASLLKTLSGGQLLTEMRGCGGDSFLARKLWVVDSFSLRWEAVVVTASLLKTLSGGQLLTEMRGSAHCSPKGSEEADRLAKSGSRLKQLNHQVSREAEVLIKQHYKTSCQSSPLDVSACSVQVLCSSASNSEVHYSACFCWVFQLVLEVIWGFSFSFSTDQF